MIIENATIHVHSAPHRNAPNIVMTNTDFIAGYEQALNSREFRATRFFTDADIVAIIQDFLTEKVDHDEAELQWHAGQITGLIAVRCLTHAYPQETDEHAPLQGQPYAPATPQTNVEAPAYGSLAYSSDWPEGTFDVIFDKTEKRGVELELSFMDKHEVKAELSALLHLKQHDIIALRDFLNQATVTRWLES